MSLATLEIYLNPSCPHCITFKKIFDRDILPRLTQLFDRFLSITFMKGAFNEKVTYVPRMDFLLQSCCGDFRVEFPHGRFVCGQDYSLNNKEDVFLFISKLVSNTRLCSDMARLEDNERYRLYCTTPLNEKGEVLYDDLLN